MDAKARQTRAYNLTGLEPFISYQENFDLYFTYFQALSDYGGVTQLRASSPDELAGLEIPM